MTRTLALAPLAMILLAPDGERLAYAHREGDSILYVRSSSLRMALDEISASVNGITIPPAVLEESGFRLPSQDERTETRGRDDFLDVVDGRPTRVRRTFERLRRTTTEDEEEHEKIGPLEGHSIVITHDGDEAVAELEGDDEAVEERFLERHRPDWSGVCLLPEDEVEVGDTWPPEEEALRRFAGLTRSELLFEPDQEENRALDEFMRENAEASGTVSLTRLEERDGLRCAVLTFSIEVEGELDDFTRMGVDLGEDVEDVSARIQVEFELAGSLWFAVEEGHPVALEQSIEGTMEFFVSGTRLERGQRLRIELHASGPIEGESATRWE